MKAKMFKAAGTALLLIGRPEFRLLVKEPVYFNLEHLYRKGGSCSLGSFGK